MPGVYVHIPFCKSRCKYCDFYSTTQMEQADRYVAAVCDEFLARRNEIGTDIATLYIGGGTPSTLEVSHIRSICEHILAESHYPAPEITMEANPGDLNFEKLCQLRQIGINRLSIGVQSFHDRLLRLIGRRHSAHEAIQVVQWARQAGFRNISLDLMYGLPTQTMDEWKNDIQTLLSLHVEHVSCYNLSYEEGTPLTRMLEHGDITPADEEVELAMYDHLCSELQKAGYEHYEVSNFALPGYYSRHNSSYWNNTPYLGLGAGAHSYDGHTRRYNRGDLLAYIACPAGVLEQEPLTDIDIYNERVMLRLRTSRGLPICDIRSESLDYIHRQCDAGLLTIEHDRIRATQAGLHILNRIIEDLMI